MNTSGNNKRIAKNTLLLYFRMLFMMVVSLYTSRVVLNALGVEDFGIYNVVGGVVAMFSMLSGSLSSAITRFITYELGTDNHENLKKIFSSSVTIQIGLALLIILLAEAVGVWFLNVKMNIPDARIVAANWVFQFSILAFAINLISVPYNADIIAHEKMSAFAYISILEVVLKLAVVFLLLVFSYDKLILYAFLILMVQLLIRFCYSYYCNRHFEESKYHHIWDKSLFKEMTGFAGWSMFGNLSGVLFGQGLNMLLNVFFGPVVNAARAVSVQVQGAIQQFVGNFQMALNPQITKTYATGKMDDMHKLMYRSARFSFYLLFFLSLPVLFETEFILTVWLKNVPENAAIFLRIMICISLIYTLSNPLMVANQATGKVKRYQAICGSILLMILPVSYVCLKHGCPAYSVFIVHFIIESITQIVRMIILRPLIGIRIVDYIKNIYMRVVAVIALSVVVPFIVYETMNETVMRFFVICIACVLSVGVMVYYVGLTGRERVFVKSRMYIMANKILHK